MNRKNIILFIALIFGFIVFFSSAVFSSFLNDFIKITVTVLLLVDVVLILVYSVVTWWEGRNSLSDSFCGIRLEILGCCIAFTVWAFAINFI